jgi:hypothetical protein
LASFGSLTHLSPPFFQCLQLQGITYFDVALNLRRPNDYVGGAEGLGGGGLGGFAGVGPFVAAGPAHERFAMPAWETPQMYLSAHVR